jgi:methylaspartate ammonia-lyase
VKINKVLISKGLSGFFFDDQAAIINQAQKDGSAYIGDVETEGFSSVRQAGESISIMLILEDGQVAYGDCAAVQYSGAGGRDSIFLADNYMQFIKNKLAPMLKGQELNSFKELANKFDSLKFEGRKMHTAIRYGITQALLDAVAKAKQKTMTEIIVEEYNLNLNLNPVPVFSQSGDNRIGNADKMIIKKADIIPHALINNVQEKLGEKGEKLLEYIKWLKKRVERLKITGNYFPAFHIDVYGTIAKAFEDDMEKMAAYMGDLASAAEPYKLKIEGPMDSGSREKQIENMKNLRKELKKRKIEIELVADEWCNTLEDIKAFVDQQAADVVQIKTPDLGGINNTIEAVLYCKKNNVSAYLGGSCNETDRSASVSVHMALASQPDQMLAKPGMGVDEGIMIVKNEMHRTLSLLEYKKKNNLL